MVFTDNLHITPIYVTGEIEEQLSLLVEMAPKAIVATKSLKGDNLDR